MIYAIALIVSQVCSPALAALFTPSRPVVGHYEVCTVEEPIDAVVKDVRGTGAPGGDDATHYGAVEDADWLTAFGSAGTYDRAHVARLYGGRGVRLARGWRKDGNRFESVTLISPYPDAALTRLNPGTLVIRFSIISESK
jgi:hypothetical protein